MTAKNSGRILELASRLGVDAIVVACPLCQMNLDLRQNQAGRAGETHFNIPVLYFTQLIGLAYDLPESELGLNKLCVSADRVVKKLADAASAPTPQAA